MLTITGLEAAIQDLVVCMFRIAHPRLEVTFHPAKSTTFGYQRPAVGLRYTGDEETESIAWYEPEYGKPGYWAVGGAQVTDLTTALNVALYRLRQRVG